MRAIFFRLVLVGAMSAVAPLAHSQLLSHRDLSYSMAKASGIASSVCERNEA